MSSLLIEKWARQAVMLERRGDFSPAAPRRIWDDLDAAKALQRQTWMQRQRALDTGPDPTALEGVYAGLNAYPNAADLTVKTGTVGEVGLLSAAEIALFTPLQPNGTLAPEAFRIAMSGNMTTVAAPGNLTITPRMGTSSSGITLGASVAFALTASITGAFWYLLGDLTLRTVGAPGTNSTAIGLFHFVGTAVAGSGAVTYNQVFGHTSASYDSSIAGGLYFGLTHTVASSTYTPRQVHWMSWN